MTEVLPIIAILVTLFGLLALGVWIGVVLLATGVITVLMYSQISFGAPMLIQVRSRHRC